MKKLTFLLGAVLSVMALFAQPPQSFKYQAVARDNSGNLIANQNVSFRISVLQGSTTGYAVYVETHSALTNQFGLVNLEIGSGTVVSGIFANINWQTGLFFLKLEMDAAGGADYQLMGISQLFSVPFALEAKHASSITLTDENGNTYTVGVDTLGNLTTTLVNPWQTCGDELTDIRDRQKYGTVLIGSHCWMAENLNIGTRIDGSQNQTQNNPDVIQKYCFNDLESNCNVYGGLYQWNEAMQYAITPGVQGICPTGWHIPTDSEWTSLIYFLGGDAVAGGKMKAMGTIQAGTGLWFAPNEGATNSSGFNALPGGGRYGNGNFNYLGFHANFWSSTESSTNDARGRKLFYDNTSVVNNYYDKYGGFSLRCLKDYTNQPPASPSNPSPSHGANNVGIDQDLSWACSDPDGNNLYYKVYFGANPSPPFVQAGLTAATYYPGTLNYNTTYYWKITAFDSYGDSAVSDVWSFTTLTELWVCGDDLVDARDSQSYNTVQIGTQCWIAENINIGNMIAAPENQNNNSIIEKYCYNNNTANCDTYGGLYQWDEMMQYTTTPGVQGICPAGWHIPTDAEWTILTTFLGGDNIAGGKMKSTGTIEAGTGLWYSPNTGATNESGFTALPGGARYDYGSFGSLGGNARFWSSKEAETNYSWDRTLIGPSANVYRGTSDNSYGFSVRCMKD